MSYLDCLWRGWGITHCCHKHHVEHVALGQAAMPLIGGGARASGASPAASHAAWSVEAWPGAQP